MIGSQLRRPPIVARAGAPEYWWLTAWVRMQANHASKGAVEATAIYRGHTSVVEDVAWHTSLPNIFGSVGKFPTLLVLSFFI